MKYFYIPSDPSQVPTKKTRIIPRPNWSPNVKPPVGTTIDWTHPLSRGLVGCWLFNEGAGAILNNLCGPWGKATKSATEVFSNNGLLTSNITEYNSITYSPALRPITGITVLVFCNINTVPIANEFPSAFGCISGDRTLQALLGYQTNSPRLILKISGTRRDMNYATPTIDVGKNVIAFTWSGADGNNQIYVNGTFSTSTNYPGTIDAATTDMFVAGAYGAASYKSGNILYKEIALWNRSLSNNEIFQLTATPYCFLAPPNPKVYILPFDSEPAGGAGILLPTGIASTEAFGTVTLRVTLLPTGISSLEAFGTSTLKSTLLPSGISSLEAFGTSTLKITLLPSGIAALEAFGTSTLKSTLLPSGISSLEAFGTSALQSTLLPSGIATLEAFGTNALRYALLPSGIPSTEAFGTSTLRSALLPSGISSLEVFGTSALKHTLLPTGIASTEAFGTANAISLLPTGIVSSEAFGNSTLKHTLLPTGIPSAEGFGTAVLSVSGVLLPIGIPSTEAFGTAALKYSLLPSGISSLEVFGTSDLALHTVGILTEEAFGTSALSLSLLQSGISSAEAFGAARITASGIIYPVGIPSTEDFGTASLVYILNPTGISSIASLGVPVLIITKVLHPSGGPSEELLGIPAILLTLITDIHVDDPALPVITSKTYIYPALNIELVNPYCGILFGTVGYGGVPTRSELEYMGFKIIIEEYTAGITRVWLYGERDAFVYLTGNVDAIPMYPLIMSSFPSNTVPDKYTMSQALSRVSYRP
jgi:hypothetical protein